MARPRRGAGHGNVRGELAAKWRAQAADYGARLGVAPQAVGGWVERADALEAGKPVLVAAWELPRSVRLRMSEAPDWYLIEPDGSVRAQDNRRM